MTPAWNRLCLARALALAAACPFFATAAPAPELPALKVFDDLQDGMWWHIHKVVPAHQDHRDGSESGCVAIADYVQAMVNQVRPAGMQCPIEVLRDRGGSAELRAQCVPAAGAGPDAEPIHYTLKRNGSDEIQLLAEQGAYRYTSRFLRIGECGSQ